MTAEAALRLRSIVWVLLAALMAGTVTASGAIPAAAAPSRTSAVAAQAPEGGTIAPQVTRYAGANRFATAAEIARRGLRTGGDTLYLATGAAFPDALAAGPVAGRAGAPILLTLPHAIPAETEAALRRAEANEIVILGGPAAVSRAVADRVRAITGVVPTRFGGTDRFDTAARVSAATFDPGVDAVYIATGLNFPDALAGGPAAATADSPLLLVTPTGVPAPVATELQRLQPTEVVVLGGQAVVPDSVLSRLRELTGVTPRRLSGANRHATASAISADLFPDGAPSLHLATGQAFPDALAGAPSASHAGGPILLTGSACLPDATAAEVLRLDPKEAIVLGGRAAIADKAAQLLPCSVNDTIPPLRVSVNENVNPTVPSITDPETGDELALDAIGDGQGGHVDVVANELVVLGSEPDVDALAARHDAEVLKTVDLPDEGLPSLAGLDVYILEVTAPPTVAPQDLVPTLTDLDPLARGEVQAGSQDVLNLLAIAAQEASDGVIVGLNPVGLGDGIVDRAAAEAEFSVPGGTEGAISGYDRNPFTWSWLNRSDPPDTGAADAWRAIALAGREPTSAAGRIPIGILDGGFFPHDDHAPGVRGIDSILNPGRCTGGRLCPFHGTQVAMAAAGLIDNGRGAAGVAGQVGQPFFYGTGGDVGRTLDAVARFLEDQPQILNMSFSFRLDGAIGFLAVPLNVVMEAAAASGVMAFASAGNEDLDVDHTECFWEVCWETEVVLPCEVSQVECVGGLAPGAISKAGNSSYGHQDVDLWAPYTVYVGAQEEPSGAPLNQARQISGTSFSAPFTAGAAALVKAADPSLSGPQVRRLLHATAGRGSGLAGRYVRVYEAVVQALGGNEPFDVEVRSPADGLVRHREETLSLDVRITDPDTTPSVRWTIDGTEVARSASSSIVVRPDNLSLGDHTVRVDITDGPYSYSESRTITVVNTEPTGEILSPEEGEEFCESRQINLQASVFDPDESDRTLEDAAVTWHRPGSGPIATGKNTAIEASVFGSTGNFMLELHGSDDGGTSLLDTVTFTVSPDSDDCGPNVRITSPSNGSSFLVDDSDGSGDFHQLTMTATADDPDGGDPIALEWEVAQASGASQPNPVFVGGNTGSSVTVKLYNNGPDQKISYEVTVTATESDGTPNTDSITVHIETLI